MKHREAETEEVCRSKVKGQSKSHKDQGRTKDVVHLRRSTFGLNASKPIPNRWKQQVMHLDTSRHISTHLDLDLCFASQNAYLHLHLDPIPKTPWSSH